MSTTERARSKTPGLPTARIELPRGVTVRDIALAAGVSIGTVSRALKNQRGLSDDTRRAVREVARGLGYGHARVVRGRGPCRGLHRTRGSVGAYR
jgi:Bacterial regulatory proteins, lacI family